MNAGNPKLEGAGQNFVYTGSADSANNTVFVDGFPCTINVEKQGLYKIEINTKDGKQNIHFDEPKLWEMFWFGGISLSTATDAVITNTYNPAVPEPTPETGSIKIQKSTVLKGEGDKETALPVTQSYQFTITPQDGIILPGTLQINNGVADAAVTVKNNVDVYKRQDFCYHRDIPFVGRIPFDMEAVQAINNGQTIVERDCAAGRAVREIYTKTMELFQYM